MTIRARDPARTREKLVRAAKRLFGERGYSGVSVTEIAKRARVSAAMINHHFGGKEGLYRACVEGFAAARLAALERLLVAPATQEELEIRLHLLVTEMLELHMEDPDMVAILLRDANAAAHWGADVERTVHDFTLRLAKFFALAAERGLLREGVDPLTPAAMIYLSLTGLLQVDAHRARVTGQTLRDPAVRKDVVDRLLDVVLRGICALT